MTSFGVSAALSSSDKSMNDAGEGNGDRGEVCALEGLVEKGNLSSRSRTRTLSSSSRPHEVVGDNGVECLLPLMFRYTVSSGGGQTPLSLGCNGFEIDAKTRCPFRTSGSDRCDEAASWLNEVRSGPGV